MCASHAFQVNDQQKKIEMLEDRIADETSKHTALKAEHDKMLNELLG
jgi:hypothetical protein